MKSNLILALVFGVVSCKASQLNELRVSGGPETNMFTLVATQETTIKERPGVDSGAKAGRICKVAKGTRVMIEGYTKFAEGSHVQVFVKAIQAGSNNTFQPPVQVGEPTIVPASKVLSEKPVNRSEPDITEVSEYPFDLTGGTARTEVDQQVHSVDCVLLGQTAYIFSKHFDGLDSAQPPLDALFEGYDREWGNRIAQAAKNQPKGNYSRSACYQYVADVLEVALGRIPNWQPLNRGKCARSFSDGWNPGINEREFRLRKIDTRDPNIVDKLPVGSVLVTATCGLQSPKGVCAGPGYGDIMIKGDEAGTMYSAINGLPQSDKCGIRSGNLISVFIPIR